MSLTKQLIKEINRANAQKSSGPTSRTGKQRSSMNAMKHNLTGQSMILLEAETEAYNRMGAAMLIDLKPKSEPERQIAQKIIDSNFRLNRLTAIENNLFSFGLADNETDCPHDDRLEVMAAQTRAWMERSTHLDTLGRYEARLSRQLSSISRNSSASRPSAKSRSASTLTAHAMKSNEINSTRLRLVCPPVLTEF